MAVFEYKTIRYEVEVDGILLLTLSRPHKMNAFTVEMCEELIDAYGRASQDDTVRAIVVTGEGNAFCAGMDLSVGGNVFGLEESLSPTMAELRDRAEDSAILSGVRDTGGRVALAMYNCLKPIVGAVNGVAVGIGSTMLLPMDFRFASLPRVSGLSSARSELRPKRARPGSFHVLSVSSRLLNGSIAPRSSAKRKRSPKA